MDLKLKKKSVLITGSSRGIGKGIAESFLQEGAIVCLTGRDPAALHEAENDFVERFGRSHVRSFQGDLLKSENRKKLLAMVQSEIGQLDHLVANIGSGRAVPPLQEDQSELKRMIEVNLFSATGIVQTFLPLLKRRALESAAGCSITFIGSICGVDALGCPVAYAMAKSGLATYARNIARPLGKYNIRVNIISPGNIMFPGSTWEDRLKTDREAVERMLENDIPLGKFGTPADIGAIATFLSSPAAGFVTGANWIIDGGQTR